MAARPADTRQLEAFLALVTIAEEVAEASPYLDNAGKKQRLEWIDECRELAKPGVAAAGLRGLQRDFLVEWNESVGPHVEAFWRGVAQAGLAVPRTRNVVAESLARGSVANMDEFTEIEDNFEALLQSGDIDEAQWDVLDALLNAFATAPENEHCFDPGDLLGTEEDEDDAELV